MPSFLATPTATVVAAILVGVLSAAPAAEAPDKALAAEIIAHRGASADAPENTLAAMKLGYEHGADAGELDIHLSRDGHIVLMHDPDTKRTAGVERKVADQTLRELRALDVGGWGDWKGKGFSAPVPTLDEAIAVVPPGRKLFIEIKCGNEALPALEQCLRRSRLTPRQTVIITFHYDVAAAAKKRFPNFQVYWLHGYGEDKRTGRFPDVDELIIKAKEASLDGLNLQHRFPLDAALIARIKAAGLKCYVWTVDDPVMARQLIEAGADGITTNRPAALRRELQEPRSSR